MVTTIRGELLRDLFHAYASWTAGYKPDCIFTLDESMRKATFDSNNTKLFILPATDPNPTDYAYGYAKDTYKFKWYLERDDGDAEKLNQQLIEMKACLKASVITGFDDNKITEVSELYYRDYDIKHVTLMGFIEVEDRVA